MADTSMRVSVVLSLAERALAPLKRISAGSAETAKQLKAAKERLKELNQQQNAVGDFRKARVGLEEMSAKLQEAQRKVGELGRVFGKAGPPTRAMATEMAKATKEANQLGQQYDTQRIKVQALRDRLSQAGISTRELSTGERRLRSDIASTTAKINAQTEALKRQAAIRQQTAKGMAVGGGMTAAGMGMAYGANRAGHAAVPVMGQTRHAATEEMRIQALGLGTQESRKAVEFAKAFKSYGTSQLDNMELMRDAITVFNDRHHAEEAMPILAKMKFANEAAFGGEQGGDNARKFMDMMKVIEMRGGANNKEDFERNANYVQQVITATGGRVGASDWMHVIQRGKLAAKGFDEKEFFYRLEPLVQEMGGDAVGTGLTAAYQNLYQGRTTKRAAQNLDKLGLIGDYSKVKHDKVGQTAQLNPGALKGADIFRRSQFEWMEKVLIPALRAKGIESEQATIDAIGSIFSNTNAGALMATMYQQRAMVQKGYELNSKAANINDLSTLAQQSPGGKEVELRKRRDDLYMRMGDSVLPGYVKLLEVLTGIAEKTSAWATDNPRMTKALLYAVAGAALLAGGLGALLIPLGLLVAKSMALRWMLARIGVTTGPLTLLKGLFMWTGRAVVGLARIAPALLRMLGPIGVLITAGWMIYSHWDTIVTNAKMLWGSLVDVAGGIWARITATVSNLISGGIGEWLAMLLNFSPFGVLWTAFTSALSMLGIQVPEQFRSFGSFIIDGLIGGITGKLGQLRDTVINVAASAAGWFKEKLGINSPSRVFTQYGGWISEGAAIGIQRGQPDVRAAALALAAAAASPVAMGQGIDMLSAGAVQFDRRPALSAQPNAVPMMGSSQINITIHAAPGMDSQELARAVASEIDRRQREQRTRRLSSLHDMD